VLIDCSPLRFAPCIAATTGLPDSCLRVLSWASSQSRYWRFGGLWDALLRPGPTTAWTPYLFLHALFVLLCVVAVSLLFYVIFVSVDSYLVWTPYMDPHLVLPLAVLDSRRVAPEGSASTRDTMSGPQTLPAI